MREQMNISVNGQSRVPPGFRFHPTEEELLHYYLRKKVANEKIDLDVICEVDLNKLEPWDIQEKCKIGTTPQNDWYFFSHKDKKYPTGTRTNRATVAGFWKATGRDKVIYSHGKRIGMRKTLVFYKGRAPHGQKSNWIMHEYRLDENPPYDTLVHISGTTSFGGDLTQEEGWVVCRIFKKNHPKATIGRAITTTSSTTTGTHTCALDSPTSDDVDPVDPIDYETTGSLDQIFQYMGPTKDQHHHNPTAEIDPMISTMMVNPKGNNLVHHAFMKLPTLESPIHTSNNPDIFTSDQNDTVQITSSGLSDWASLDRLVASQLNGQVTDGFKQLSSAVNYTDATMGSIFSMVDHDIDNLWSFTRSSSSSILPTDPLCHVSDAGM